MPFSQYTKDSIQDKEYQLIEGDQRTLNNQELEEIFFYKTEEDCMDKPIELSNKEILVLKKALLLSKSVLQQTNHTKW